jgi:hypothetical protein
MAYISNKTESSSSSSNFTVLSNTLFDEMRYKIRQAYGGRKSNLNNDQRNWSSEKISKSSTKTPMPIEVNTKNYSLHQKMILIRRSLLQEKLYSKEIENNRTVLDVSKDKSVLDLHNNGNNKISNLNSIDSNKNSLKGILHLQKPLINKENESLYYHNYGKIEPINWSFLHEVTNESQDSQNFTSIQNEQEESFDKVEEVSENIPEANLDFINFVNNSITQNTVFTIEGNINEIYDTFDSSILNMERTVSDSKEITITIGKDVQKAFEPVVKERNIMDLINSPINKSIQLQNEKSESNSESDVQQNVKNSGISDLDQEQSEESSGSYKLKSINTETFEPCTNNKSNKNEDMINDDMFHFLQFKEQESSSSVTSKNSNVNKIFMLQKQVNSESSTKKLLYNKFNSICKKMPISSESDKLSLANNNLQNLSGNKCIDNDILQLKNSDVKTELKQQANTQIVDLNFVENISGTIDSEDYKKLSSNTDLDENEMNNLKSTSNEEAVIKTKYSSYFLKLLNLMNKVDNENDEECNTSEIEKVSHSAATEANIKQDDIIACDQNSCLSRNSNENLPKLIENINSSKENLALLHLNELKDKSHNSCISSRSSLSSVISDEEFDVGNYKSFPPFLDLINELKNQARIQKDIHTNVINSNNLEATDKNTGLNDNIKSSNNLKSDNSSEVLGNSYLSKKDSLSNYNVDNEIYLNSSNISNLSLNNIMIKNEDSQFKSSSNIQSSSNSIPLEMSKKRKNMVEALKKYKSTNLKSDNSSEVLYNTYLSKTDSSSNRDPNKNMFLKFLEFFKL